MNIIFIHIPSYEIRRFKYEFLHESTYNIYFNLNKTNKKQKQVSLYIFHGNINMSNVLLSTTEQYWHNAQVLFGLQLLLQRHSSTSELYRKLEERELDGKELKPSYSQFNRYLKGNTITFQSRINYYRDFLLSEINLVEDLILPRIKVEITTTPIQVDLTELYNFPSAPSFIAYYVSSQQNLFNKFDVILTHPEAIPLAIGFSQILGIPWYSVSTKSPAIPLDKITRYPYYIDKEHVSTLFFNAPREVLNKKRVLILSDYIRRGGLLDILFRVVEDNSGEVCYLLALIGIGNTWKHFHSELSGELEVIYHL
jgi:adenine/guanine phosphoribosyltransferase-like PRPP-binding protein